MYSTCKNYIWNSHRMTFLLSQEHIHTRANITPFVCNFSYKNLDNLQVYKLRLSLNFELKIPDAYDTIYDHIKENMWYWKKHFGGCSFS